MDERVKNNMKVGDCLLCKGIYSWDEEYFRLYRVLDIEVDICEAYCYEIKESGFSKEMAEIDLPLSTGFTVISVEIHDKITKLINDTITSVRSIMDNAKTSPVSSVKSGDCFLISLAESESIGICRNEDSDWDSDNKYGEPEYDTSVYILGRKGLRFDDYLPMTKSGIVHDYNAVSVSPMEYNKIEKLFSLSQRAIRTLINGIIH